MNPLLKYTFYFICFAAFLLGGNDSVTAADSSANGIYIESQDTEIDFMFSESDDFESFNSEISHSRSSITVVSRLHNGSRRTDTMQKNFPAFVKAGKLIDIGAIFCFHNTFKLKHSFFSEPANKLICLGKLII